MTENLGSDYKKLMERTKDLAIFMSAGSVIMWDMETMMPPKAIGLRSQQLALLSRIQHKMGTDPEVGALIEKIMRHPNYDKLDA
ncbi:carboxypeptidase M32, partial [Candidatus Bathyarchaeota archaeon]|nr:carboxypeptidase M32 [Candidatus Bathyarchaeota archaeon]